MCLNFDTHRIQKVSIHGDCLLQIGGEGKGVGGGGKEDGQLLCPCGIAIYNERLYVSESNRISVFQLDGEFCCTIGSGQLQGGWDVTISDGRLLATDFTNCISTFALDGTYMGRFNKDELSHPIGLTTDKHGFVLVADNGNHCIAVFDQDGVCVCRFGYGTEDEEFLGISVSPNGNIYVADADMSKILIF